MHQRTQNFEDAPVIERASVGGHPPIFGGLGGPKLKITAIAKYETDVSSLTVQQRWRSKLALNGNPTLDYSDPPLPPIGQTDVTLTLTPLDSKKFELFLSIENLFNTKPDPFAVNAYASVPGYFFPAANGDDIIGRYFTSGVRLKF